MKGEKKKEKEKQKNLEKMEEVIKNKNKIVDDYNKKIQKKILQNIAFAIVYIIFFYLLYLGSQNIETNIYLTDLKVFAFGLLILAIIIFEYSYKKDNGAIAIHGIEILVTSIIALFLTYMSELFVNRIYILIITCIAIIYVVYFIIKSFIILYTMKKQYFKQKDDIKDIIKK